MATLSLFCLPHSCHYFDHLLNCLFLIAPKHFELLVDRLLLWIQRRLVILSFGLQLQYHYPILKFNRHSNYLMHFLDHRSQFTDHLFLQFIEFHFGLVVTNCLLLLPFLQFIINCYRTRLGKPYTGYCPGNSRNFSIALQL